MNDYHQLIANAVVAHSLMIGRFIDYIEVGVLTGNSADAVLSTCRVRNAVLIDNWSLQTPPSSRAQVEERLSRFAEIFRIMDGQSSEILPKLIVNQFDIGFVDGDHTNEACQSDMTNMLPLLRDEGIMFVHDVGNGDFPDLDKLVEKFATVNNLVLTIHPVMNGLAELTRN